jgi:tRNA threonylcarbamoyladenosine modification (KEOPS) complex  Pcc1 subunit
MTEPGAHLLSAKLVINVGEGAKDYIKVVGRGEKYKRGSISFSAKKNAIEVAVKADDPAALLASLNSALKQLTIVDSVRGVIKKK